MLGRVIVGRVVKVVCPGCCQRGHGGPSRSSSFPVGLLLLSLLQCLLPLLTLN